MKTHLTPGSYGKDGVTRRSFLRTALAGGTGWALVPGIWARESGPLLARGVVWHDRGGDGRRRVGDPGVPGVAVSNGREVTVTDEMGRWSLPVEGEATTFFVIKPRGWSTVRDHRNLPRFYYHHQPAGSPSQRFRGISPSGALPQSIDFPLRSQDEPDRFKAIICGDPQPRNDREVRYLAQSMVPALAGTDAAFGVSLGDIAFDDLATFEPLSEAVGLLGVPWHNVLGNHDLNFDAPDNRTANETFRSVFGPTYYAFDYGPVHFLVLNNVEWLGPDPQRPQSTGNYRGKLGARQLEFVARDLERVPSDRLVVLMMHIPLQRGFAPNPASETADRQELYRLLEGRPHTLSFSAHTHWHRHLFIGEEDGWRGARPHHHIITGALCGSWFGGAPDELGVPHGTMSDGTPRGYLELEFAGQGYRMDGYCSFGRPREYQMHIEVPEQVARGQLPEVSVAVNVFNGSERSRVRLRCGSGDAWRELAKVDEPDPRFLALRERDATPQPPYRALPHPLPHCPHLWRGPVPPDLPAGTHLIEVMADDMFGNTHYGRCSLRVLA